MDLTEHQVHAIVGWTQHRAVQKKKADAAARGGIHLDAGDLGE
jgi:hypothetical protein